MTQWHEDDCTGGAALGLALAAVLLGVYLFAALVIWMWT